MKGQATRSAPFLFLLTPSHGPLFEVFFTFFRFLRIKSREQDSQDDPSTCDDG